MKELVKLIQKKFDTDKEYNSKGLMIVQSILDLGDYFVVTMTLRNLPKDDFMVDGQFKLDKKLSKITPFSPEMDREKYFKALEKPLYVRYV